MAQTRMRRLDAQQVAELLLEIGRRSSLEGGNPYKASAYIRAAESLRALVVPLGEVIGRSQLRALPVSATPSRAASLNLERRARTRVSSGSGPGIPSVFSSS